MRMAQLLVLSVTSIRGLARVRILVGQMLFQLLQAWLVCRCPAGLAGLGAAGADVRAVAYNYFLEGSLFRDEPVTVDPKRYVWDLKFGVTARFDRYNLTYAIVRRSEEFERTVGTDRGIHNYASLSLTIGIP